MALTHRDRLFLILFWLVWAAFFWPLLSGQSSLYFRDTAQVYHPLARITEEYWRRGELPFWEPRIGLGYPYLANPHSVALYPLTALLLAGSFPWSYSLFVTIHVALAGTFQFLLLRRWELGLAASALGAAIAAFGGFTITMLDLTPLLRGYCWMPLALYTFDRWLCGSGARSIAATALVLAIQGSGSDPHYVLMTLLLLAVSPWLRPRGAAVGLSRLAAGVASTAALAGGLLAWQAATLGELVAVSGRARGVGLQGAEHFDVDPANLASLVLPLPFPDLVALPVLFPFNFHDLAVPFFPYIFVGFPALLVACASGGSSHRRAAAAAIAIAALLVSFGERLPLYDWLIAILPPLKLSRFPAKYFMLVAQLFPLLAACGLQSLEEAQPGAVRWLKRAAALAAVAVVLGLVALSLAEARILAWHSGPPGRNPDVQLALGSVAGRWTVELWLGLLVIAAVAALALLAERGRLSWPRAACLLSAVGACQIVYVGYQGLSVVPASLVSEPPATAHLLPPVAPGRPPPRLLVYPSPIDRGLFALPMDRQLRLYGALLEGLRGAHWGYNALLSDLPVPTPGEHALAVLYGRLGGKESDAVARALGAEAALRVTEMARPTNRGRLEGVAGQVAVRRWDDATPRAFIAARAEPASSPVTVPSMALLLEMPARVVYEGSGEVLAPARVRSCRVASYAPRAVTVDVDFDGEGVLVLVDEHYPGWTARAGDGPRELVRVDGLLRGVKLRQGDRRISLSYEPSLWRPGVAVSLLSLLLACGLILRQTCLSASTGSILDARQAG